MNHSGYIYSMARTTAVEPKGVTGMKRAVCCKCRVMRSTNEMVEAAGCLGQIVWLCQRCSSDHHKQQIREILIDAESQGINIDKWRHLLD